MSTIFCFHLFIIFLIEVLLFQIENYYINRDAICKTAAHVKFVMLMSIEHLCKKT